MNTYDFKRTAIKGLRALVVFILPVLVNNFIVEFPAIAQLTVGAVLLMALDFLKRWVGLRLP